MGPGTHADEAMGEAAGVRRQGEAEPLSAETGEREWSSMWITMLKSAPRRGKAHTRRDDWDPGTMRLQSAITPNRPPDAVSRPSPACRRKEEQSEMEVATACG